MPIKECVEDKKPGFRYGDTGKCYTVDDPEDEKALLKAKKKAIKQAAAIYDSEAHLNEAYKKAAQIIFDAYISLNANCKKEEKNGIGIGSCGGNKKENIDKNQKVISKKEREKIQRKDTTPAESVIVPKFKTYKEINISKMNDSAESVLGKIEMNKDGKININNSSDAAIAMYHYSNGFYYTQTNQYLAGVPDNKIDWSGYKGYNFNSESEFKDRVKRDADLLKDKLNLASIPENIICIRGVRRDRFNTLLKSGNGKKGNVVTNDILMSATFDEKIASIFSLGLKKSFFIEIKMPVGTKAAFVDQYSYSDQKHVVIAPSQKFRVIDYEKTDNYEKLIWEAIVSK